MKSGYIHRNVKSPLFVQLCTEGSWLVVSIKSLQGARSVEMTCMCMHAYINAPVMYPHTLHESNAHHQFVI